MKNPSSLFCKEQQNSPARPPAPAPAPHPCSPGPFEVELISTRGPSNLPCSFVDRFIKHPYDSAFNFYPCGEVNPLFSE